jgi:DNA-binding beta-propeller fold protein YncE
MRKLLSFVLLVSPLAVIAQSSTTLSLTQTILLPGITGKFDHLAIDLAGDRLFAAATGNHSVEVIDLKSGKVTQSIAGLGKPHGLAWVEATGSLFVADGTLAELRVYRGSPLKFAGAIKLSDDADDMVYDDAHHLLYVGHGGGSTAAPGRVAVVDTASFTLVANLPVAAHPEALDLDGHGRRIFANVADSSEVAVIDGATNTIEAHWKLNNAEDNVPMAYAGRQQKLYVACRTPATLLALDATTGAETSRASTGEGADDLFYDAALARVYVISGSEVDAFDVRGATIQSVGITRTAPGAKTALFVPAKSALYIAVPAAGGNPAEIRVYSTSIQKETK